MLLWIVFIGIKLWEEDSCKRRWIAELKRERQKKERDKMMKGTLMNVPEHFHADLQASDCPMFLYSPVHPAMQHLPYLSIFAYIFLWILVGFMHMISQCIICIHICISDTHVEFIKFYFVRNSFVAHNA